MSIRPIADRVLIQRIEEETRSPGGIIIPENHREKPVKGKIIAVGSGKRMKDGSLLPLAVVPGDIVLFGKHSGTIIKDDGQEFLIMKEEEILSMVVED